MTAQEPVKYVDALAEYYGAMGHPPYRWTVNEDAPLMHLTKPVNQARVTMLTSGGISMCAMPAWDPMSRNDHRLDAIPADADVTDFQIHDSYYDHSDAERDLNCLLPVDRLHELAEAGEIGEVSQRHWSGFMGRTYNRSKVLGESAPAFADELLADQVDLLIAIPA